eukprot:scaffold543_cov119-Cylindrotheca_fusiformis.AAC.26
MAKIAIIYYSLYGHVATMAESIKEGLEAGGATVDIYQVEENLNEEILGKMGAPPKKDHPVMTAEKMPEYDGFMFGISGRYGSIPAQLKELTASSLHSLLDFAKRTLNRLQMKSRKSRMKEVSVVEDTMGDVEANA